MVLQESKLINAGEGTVDIRRLQSSIVVSSCGCALRNVDVSGPGQIATMDCSPVPQLILGSMRCHGMGRTLKPTAQVAFVLGHHSD